MSIESLLYLENSYDKFNCIGSGHFRNGCGGYSYFEGKKNLDENIRLAARYVIIDLASWDITMCISHAFAKKDSNGRAQMDLFLLLATTAGLIFNHVFFNWATQPLESTSQGSDKFSSQKKWAIGSAAFLGGNVAWLAMLYFINKK